MFNYNHETAMSADQTGSYITESCVVRGLISYAKWSKSVSSQAEFIEIGLDAEDGRKANYISICFRKSDGSVNDYGDKQIHSLMGCTGLQSLTNRQVGTDFICPELKGRQVAIALERTNYTKNDGSQGYKMEAKSFMRADTWQTVKEHATQHRPETCEYWKKVFSENPSGKQSQSQNNSLHTTVHNHPVTQSATSVQTASYNQQQAQNYQQNAFDPSIDDSIPF